MKMIVSGLVLAGFFAALPAAAQTEPVESGAPAAAPRQQGEAADHAKKSRAAPGDRAGPELTAPDQDSDSDEPPTKATRDLEEGLVPWRTRNSKPGATVPLGSHGGGSS